MVRIIIFSLLHFRIVLSLFFCRSKERREGKKMRDRKWVWGRGWKQRIQLETKKIQRVF